jgi:HNH endonuclease
MDNEGAFPCGHPRTPENTYAADRTWCLECRRRRSREYARRVRGTKRPYFTLSPRERFWSLALGNVESGCVEWQGSTAVHGYGTFKLRNPRRTVLAHRFALELEVGPIPDEMRIGHTCFNRRCVRIDHLQLLSATEKVRRALARRKVRS